MTGKHPVYFGRCERIRTSDPFVPNEVRYQAAPHTDFKAKNYTKRESGNQCSKGLIYPRPANQELAEITQPHNHNYQHYQQPPRPEGFPFHGMDSATDNLINLFLIFRKQAILVTAVCLLFSHILFSHTRHKKGESAAKHSPPTGLQSHPTGPTYPAMASY